ncbi:AraC family transcriptional regulator [Dictyobacter sp. S3.2.2.5]|uniref:AraC family transcriptional regulator n=1 Tax=Dictyobacter halimunensis TaxID=3026934 RepID=A0ABQ6FK61_9CHLR|nr:AraC family transcriptional regulator [Dictyobacter sp. S3.2.2.5]
MIFFDEQRPSSSPFVELIWRSHSEDTHPFLSIAVNRIELVVSKLQGKTTLTVRGPETRATPVGDCPADGEWLGILLKPGVFLSHLPIRSLVDDSVDLEAASTKTFWLGGSTWQFPTYENADTFVDWLVHEGLLVRDPLIEAILQGRCNDLTPRSVQYRFLRSTGITQNAVRQIERARSATFLLQHGVSIADTIVQTGYYDQPHLTRSLRHFIGQTPAQLLHHSQPEQLSLLYKTIPFP